MEQYNFMNSRTGRDSAQIAEQVIKIHPNNNVYRRTIHTQDEKYAIVWLQLFTDKFQTSLSTEAFTLYPMHVKLINFNGKSRRNKITNDRTVFEYLPVLFVAYKGDWPSNGDS